MGENMKQETKRISRTYSEVQREGNIIPGRGVSKCKGSEAGRGSLENTRKIRVAADCGTRSWV